MTRDGYDVRTIYDDRGAVAGYVCRKQGLTAWSAILDGYCSCCAPEKGLGRFPDLASAAAAVAASVKAGSRQ
jgi:hypothetical protein